MINFVFYASPSLTLMCLPRTADSAYSLEAAAQLTRVHPDRLRRYCQLGLFGVQAIGRDTTFNESGIAAIRRIDDYRRVQGANLASLPIICGLWNEVECLQQELKWQRR